MDTFTTFLTSPRAAGIGLALRRPPVQSSLGPIPEDGRRRCGSGAVFEAPDQSRPQRLTGWKHLLVHYYRALPAGQFECFRTGLVQEGDNAIPQGPELGGSNHRRTKARAW